MSSMKRTVKCNDACTGCTYEIQQIPRTVQFREIWTQLSPACDAEQRAYRESARAAHAERTRLRALEEEFT